MITENAVRALVCAPPDTVDKGMRKKFLGEVSVERAREQHKEHCLALRDMGFSLLTMLRKKINQGKN
ncbi:MAG: hypothetical protein AAB897_00240 [Patescibacteria group bacterium]